MSSSGGAKRRGPAVVHEVALVDRLQPQRVAGFSECREDGAAVLLGLGQQAVGPEDALGRRVDGHGLPDVSEQKLSTAATVRSISSSPCAVEGKSASNCEGGT